MTTKLKGSDRQKMLIEYVKNGTVPDGFYVITTKKGLIQFRRKKDNDVEKQIQKLEEKIKELKQNGTPCQRSTHTEDPTTLK